MFVAGIVWIGLLMSCQKTPYSDLGATLTTPPPATQIDLLKDSVFLYSKEVYLWTEVIPDYQKFNPRGYSGSTDLEAAENVMDGIRALQPLDRFSFVTTEEEAAGIQTGEDKDYGFLLRLLRPTWFPLWSQTPPTGSFLTCTKVLPLEMQVCNAVGRSVKLMVHQ